ncbi:M56 family metallopeptidase [Nocardia sp. NBC_01388]|uniref:M56 family metallopeptidase n=1 Tax=Nocardia sp. NBC_01388 TaxID=2903596 RepID=UPI00324C73C1
MSIAICVLMYSFTTVMLAPRLLVRLTRTGAAPRLGLIAWLSAIGSVAFSWLIAASILVVDVFRDWTAPTRLMFDSCITQLHDATTGQYGSAVQVSLFALAGFTAAAAAVAFARLGGSLLRARRATHTHARMARLAGRHDPELDAVVLDLSEAAAYCVAGKPNTVVVTRGVLEALDDRHLGAVLAHERAHLAGRHHLLLAISRGLATAFPRVQLFSGGGIEVARLVEMRADDDASGVHGRLTVQEALLALSEHAQSPAATLPVVGDGLATRVERLARPIEQPVRTRTRILLVAMTVLILIGPLISTTVAVIGVAACLPIAL